MPGTQTTTNTASTTFSNKTYYDKKLLEYAKTKFVHAKFGQKRPIPRHGGKQVEFRRWELFDPTLAANGLTEGVTPEAQDIRQTHVEATVKQYGAFVEVSDLADMTQIDNIKEDSVELLGEQMGTVLDWVVRDAMAATATVQYAGGKMSRSEIGTADKLSIAEIRKALVTLKRNKPRHFNGSEGGSAAGKPHFICIISPEAAYDLQADEEWVKVSQYQDKERIYSGEIGRMFGVVFVESTEAKVFEDAGASGVDVHAALLFGKDAYGLIDIEGSGAIRSIQKGFGSSGTEDPLDQRATVGAKIPAFTAKVLNDNWIIRIEHGVSVG